MSSKSTGTIWDLKLSVPHRMILLAMADHADHDGEHIHAPAPFIAWKTGYSLRSVYRLTQELVDLGILVVTDRTQGEANEYRFDFSQGELKPPHQGIKPKSRRATPAKMSGGTPAKMSGGAAKMSGGAAKMSGGTPAKMAIDHGSTLLENHDSPPPPTNPMSSDGGGGDDRSGKPEKTATYHWLRANGVESPGAAERNQHHDLAATQALYRRMVGDVIGDERKKRIGRFIRSLDADGPPPIAPPTPRTNGHYTRATPDDDANDPAETARKLRERTHGKEFTGQP